MAITIMGGLFVATVLTLLVVPALYALWFRVRENEPATAAATRQRMRSHPSFRRFGLPPSDEPNRNNHGHPDPREPGPFREPTLEEILSDSIVEALMRADAVDPRELRTLLREVANLREAASGHADDSA